MASRGLGLYFPCDIPNKSHLILTAPLTGLCWSNKDCLFGDQLHSLHYCSIQIARHLQRVVILCAVIVSERVPSCLSSGECFVFCVVIISYLNLYQEDIPGKLCVVVVSFCLCWENDCGLSDIDTLVFIGLIALIIHILIADN